MMRGLFILIACVLMGCAAKGSSPFAPGKQAPLTRFYLLDGSYISSEDLLGKNVMLLFWSGKCSLSMGRLHALAEEKRLAIEQGRNDIVFLAVNIDEDREFVEEVITVSGAKNILNAFSGNGVRDEAFIAFRGEGVPLGFVIDQSGVILEQDDQFDCSKV